MTLGMVILAGGLGTRLRSVLGTVPKALAPVGGAPVLEHHARLAARYGIQDVVVLTGVGADQIDAVCGDGNQWGVRLRSVREAEPIGTAGALMAALDLFPERFVVSYGDAMMDVALDRMIDAHHISGASATLMLHPNDHPQDSDLVEVDGRGRVTAVHGYPHPAESEYANLVNAALYVFERSALRPYVGVMRGRDIAKHLIPQMLVDGAAINGYRSREYIKDLGTPERLERVNRDYRNGVIARRNLAVAATAVFVDRDGTVNEERHHLAHHDTLVLIPGAATGVRRLNESGLLAVVLTNQPVLARGECSDEEMRRIHARLETLLGAERAFLDALYLCPHHPDAGFVGECPELKQVCACRKPATGLLDAAVRELHIDLGTSWMIGDTTTDIEMAARAGLQSILVHTGYGGLDGRFHRVPDYEFADLDAATGFITRRFDQMLACALSVVSDLPPGGIILLGGLARAGKSTWASVIRAALRHRGLVSHRISCDEWLLPENQRRAGLRGRYQYSEMEAAVRSWAANASAGLSISTPDRMYDRHARSVVDRGECRRVAASDVIILEGVPALDLDLADIPSLRLAVWVEESVRFDRFQTAYRRRGVTVDEIAQRWEARGMDEHALIGSSVATATHVLSGDVSRIAGVA